VLNIIIMVVIAARDENPSVGEQHRVVLNAGCVEVGGDSPSPGGRVVKLRTVECVKVKGFIADAPGDENFSIWQQRRRVSNARKVEFAGATPRPRSRVIQ